LKKILFKTGCRPQKKRGGQKDNTGKKNDYKSSLPRGRDFIDHMVNIYHLNLQAYISHTLRGLMKIDQTAQSFAYIYSRADHRLHP